MTNKSMIGKDEARERTRAKPHGETPRDTKNPTHDTSPDSPQLKPELDETPQGGAGKKPA